MKTKRRQKKMIPVPMDEPLIKQIDAKVPGHFSNRSEFIREACRHMIDQMTIQEKEVLYEKGYRKIPEQTEWPKVTGKIIPEVWNEEDWS